MKNILYLFWTRQNLDKRRNFKVNLLQRKLHSGKTKPKQTAPDHVFESGFVTGGYENKFLRGENQCNRESTLTLVLTSEMTVRVHSSKTQMPESCSKYSMSQEYQRVKKQKEKGQLLCGKL